MQQQTIDNRIPTQQQCIIWMNDDFQRELGESIISRVRWKYLSKILDVSVYVFQASTTVLAFASASIVAPHAFPLAFVAGCTGVCGILCASGGQYCKSKYKSATRTIQDKIDIPAFPSVENQDIEVEQEQENKPHSSLPILNAFACSSTYSPVTSSPIASASYQTFSEDVYQSMPRLTLNP